MKLLNGRTMALILLLAFVAGAGCTGAAYFYLRLQSLRYTSAYAITNLLPISGVVDAADPSTRRVVLFITSQNAHATDNISFLVPETVRLTKQRPIIQNGALVGFDIPEAASFADLAPGAHVFATIEVLGSGDLSARMITIGDPLPRP